MHKQQWLQEAFDVPLVIQLTDDEKFQFKQNVSLCAHTSKTCMCMSIYACVRRHRGTVGRPNVYK